MQAEQVSRRLTRFGARTPAISAGLGALVGELFLYPERRLFERDDDLFLQLAGVARSRADPEPSQEVAEDAIHVEIAQIAEIESHATPTPPQRLRRLPRSDRTSGASSGSLSTW